MSSRQSRIISRQRPDILAALGSKLAVSGLSVVVRLAI